MKCIAPLLLLSASLLPACGPDGEVGSSGPAEASEGRALKEDRAKAALEALFASVRANDVAAAARRIVYRGPDRARRWKSLCDYTQADDRARVDDLVRRLRAWIGDGPVAFVEFRSDRQREGEWLVWKVEARATTAWYACLDIDGTIALGDVDTD